MSEDCPICAKHCGAGPLVGPRIWADDQVVVSHRPPGDDGTTVLGYVFIETRRHVPVIDKLTSAEVSAVASAAWRASRALRAETAAEFVFSAIAGRGVAHFHQHVFTCHPGTPAHVAWTEVADWAGAPRGTMADLEALSTRLGRHFH